MDCVGIFTAGAGALRCAARSAWLGGVSLVALLLASGQVNARNLGSIGTIAPTAAASQAAIAAAQQAAAAAAQGQTSLARAAAALAAARRAQQGAAALSTQPTQANGQAIPDGVGANGLLPTGGVTGSSCGTSCTAFQLNTPDSFKGADSTLIQTVNGGQTKVDITQKEPKAIYNWDSFNISRGTTLNFNQQRSDWIAFNRVDPKQSPVLFLQNATSNNGRSNPSYIGGQINAPGVVYVINRNGIIFGAGAQINVNSLIASTLDVGQLGTDQDARDNYFRTNGIASGIASSFSLFDPVGGDTTTLIPGNVTVEAGASITAHIATDVDPKGSPGFIYLFGANVYNYGMLTAPRGEVAMAAARAITLTPNQDYAASFPGTVLPSGVTFRGTGLELQRFGPSYDDQGIPKGNSYFRDDVNHVVTGEVSHGGVIDVRQGIALLAGDRVTVTNLQDASGRAVRDAAGNLVPGVISADSSITRNSMVLMHAATNVTMDGVISMLPYDDGNTLPMSSGAATNGTSSTVQSFTPAYVEMSAQLSVTMGASSLISAPSAAVSLNAVSLGGGSVTRQLFEGNGVLKDSMAPSLGGPQQVLLNGNGPDGPGATIDVAGLQNVVLPASYNFISFNPRGQFADMPLQRPPAAGVLYGQTLWFDIRASGTRSDGTTWVGTPLADASGEVGGVGRSIYQLMTSGGTVSLTTDTTTANTGIAALNRQVIANSGSVINVAGGNITFLPGMVPATRLVGIDGRIYSMANADPNMVYVGIAGQFTANHARWRVTETWSSWTFSPGYTEGHDAGGVTVTTISPQLDLGQMYFGSVAGQRQIAFGNAPSDTSDSTRPTARQAKGDQLPSQGYLSITTPSNVQIGPTPSSNFNTQDPLTHLSDPLTHLSADTLSGYGLSALNVTAYDLTVSSGSSVKLAAGGTFSALVGGAIDIAGTISAASGTVNLQTDQFGYAKNFPGSPPLKGPTDPATGAVIAANVFVEGSLDVSGRFVNDTGRFGTDAQGPAFINGGSISITTNKFSVQSTNKLFSDRTGSILLASGSVLDVSSGGYISPQGKAKTVSTGVLAGKAGSISFMLYQGGTWLSDPNSANNLPPTASADSHQAVLALGGALLAYGFESNGSLRLGVADTIRIGGAGLQQGETSTIRVGQGSTLPSALLNSGGFSSYILESISDGYTTPNSSQIILSGSANLNLQQSNLSSTLNYGATPTGTKLGVQAQQAPATQLSRLPDDVRKPVDLTLKADNVVLETGSSVVTDPKAKITIGGSPDFTKTLADRDAPAGKVLLGGSIVDHGGTVFINANQTIFNDWLPKQQARIDLSGTFIANPLFGQTGGPATSGTVIAGGTLSIESGTPNSIGTGNATNYLYSEPSGSVQAGSGLQVDVSGYAGVVQTAAGSRGQVSSTWLWSDAGTVSMDVVGYSWGGSFAAIGGRLATGSALLAADGKTAIANNGTFILGGGQIELNPTNANSGKIRVSTDQLAPFDNVFLYSGAAQGGAGRIFTDLPESFAGLPESTVDLRTPGFSPLTIAGSLNWHVANTLHIAASSIKMGKDGSSVALDAPYVLLTGGGGAVSSGTSTIIVKAQTIDVEGAAFSGFSQVQLKSSGDLRLSTPKVANTIDSNSGLVTSPSLTGTLATSGDLVLFGQRIYPVSAVDFTITNTTGNVTFAAPMGSNTRIPLSAGGSLTVTAANIDQGGNLFAPLGKITLTGGSGTNPDGSNQGVVLEPGSLTSVTLADTTVPYGATAGGTGWYYNSNAKALSSPPAKGLELDGAGVVVKAGSTIDERGGGDLQAMEWIPGSHGSHDTLTSINGGLGASGSLAGPTVYALVPSSNDPVAAFDIHFTAASGLNAAGKSGTALPLPSGQVLYLQSGDVVPLAGSQITIAGGGGIAAGSYTLYPAHYATLPGALRVVYYGDTTGRKMPSGTTLPDGTVLVTGNYTQSTAPGKQSSGQAMFAVQTGAVWQQYSEYSFSSANAYFPQQAVHNRTAVPRLPIDAGRLAVNVQQQVVLAGTALVQPAPGGRSSELDIAGNQLAVVSHQQYVDGPNPGNVPAGYIPLDVSQLNGFGFQNILIGGTRSDDDPATGTLITPKSTSVVVDTRGEALTVPEAMLVTQAKGQWVEQDQWFKVGSTLVYVPLALYQPAANDGSIEIRTGSIIATTGKVDVGYGRNYHFAPLAASALSRAREVAESLGGTLQSDGTTITNIDLAGLNAFWYGSGWKSWAKTTGVDLTSLGYYAFGGPTTKQPGLGAVFAASNDAGLTLSGPTGVPAVQALTLQFKDLSTSIKFTDTASGNTAAKGTQVTGPVTDINGNAASLVVPGGDAGKVTIAAGATIATDTLTLQATASKNAITINGDVHARQVNLTAQTFAIGSGAASAASSVQLSGSQFANVQGLALKSLSGAISVYGSFDAGQTLTSLTLDAAAVVRAAGSGDGRIAVENGTIKLVNDTGLGLPAGVPLSENNALAFAAADIVLGGTQTIGGSNMVSMRATDRVLIASSGTLTLGTGSDQVNLAVSTPSVLVAGATSSGSGSFTLTTQGDVTLTDLAARTGMAQRPVDGSELGGNFAVIASHIAVGNTIQAQAGTVTLEATGADVVNGDGSIRPAISLTNGAYIAAGGATKTLADTTTYVAGGKVLLQADPAGGGSVFTSATSVIDVAQPADGIGYGGQIQIAATAGRAVVLGDLRGRGGVGLGGSFKVDANSLQVDGNGFDPNATLDVKLDALADKLLAGGLDGAIDIHTRAGNLTLSQGHTLRANSVTLTADDTRWGEDPASQYGQVIIAGTIDASGYAGTTADGTGQAGGQVGLYGANQVTLAGTSFIDASTAHADERGGDVMVGIPWAAQGKIRLQDGLRIDVSGGTKGGWLGGTVTFRAPVDGNGGAKIVEINASGTEQPTFDGSRIHITGARAVTVEPFIAFDTVQSSYGLKVDGWDGYVDPAGQYDAGGNQVEQGHWTGVTGTVLNFDNATGYAGVPKLFDGSAVRSDYIVTMGVDSKLQLTTTASLQIGDKVTFDTLNGKAAQGTVTSIDASGAVTVSVSDPGSGYTARPTSISLNGATASVSLTSGGLKVVSITCNPCQTFTTNSSLFLVQGGKVGATSVPVVVVSSLTGSTNKDGKFTLDANPRAATTLDTTFDKLVKDSAVFSADDIVKHKSFFGTNKDGTPGTLMAFSQGSLTLNNQDYGFSKLISSLQPLAQQLGAGVVHVRPGIELVNSDPKTNSGNITVKTAWNLAAGDAYNLQTNTYANGTTNSTYVQVYDSSTRAQQSYVTFDYRLVVQDGYGTNTPAVEAGALTLRAVNDVIIGASISDGFFQFRNYLDKSYGTALANYLASASISGNSRGIDPFGNYQYYLNGSSSAPVAPYSSTANVVSPTAQDLAAADLFPNQLNVCVSKSCGTPNTVGGGVPQGVAPITNPGSWTYRITAGAALASANPNAVRPLGSTIYNPKGATVYNGNDARLTRTPSVTVTGTGSYTPSTYNGSVFTASAISISLPTMVRTGTGSIDVSAGFNVSLSDSSNTAAPGVIYAAGVNTPRLIDPQYRLQTVNGISKVVVGNTGPDVDPSLLFLEPQLLAYGSSGSIYGPPTAPAFPHMGGDVQLTAQNDVIGFSPVTSTTAKTAYQYYKQWLLANASITPAATTAAAVSISVRGQGVFAPIGTSIASQTAWWIEYGSFDQGILSAGGNVTVTAGRDINDLSVSLPTTGRVSGGLTATSTPKTNIYDSGNMTVSAGHDILGGSFYEGSGHASIVAGRAVGATTEKLSWTGLDKQKSAVTLDNLPLLAVDTGRIQITAGGSISIAGVINPAALHSQDGSSANPVAGTSKSTAIFMDTYGPNSFVGLQSLTGNLTIAITPTAINSSATSPSLYPASFEAVALGGNITTTGLANQTSTMLTPGVVLSGSEAGNLQLLAEGSIDLSFGATPGKTFVHPYISSGPALLDKAFDPYRPDAWYGTHVADTSYGGALFGTVLAHQNDHAIARIIAATGNITAAGATALDNSTQTKITGFKRVEINHAAEIYAGGNITDLNLLVENIRPSDVSSVVAGGNITYTGDNIAGGLQVAGPGFFVVQAGGDLGPFLPVSADTAPSVKQQQGIASVGNASFTPVGNDIVATGIYDTALLGPPANQRRNELLSTRGADVIAMFGVSKGINYNAVLDTYVNPANAANVPHNYLSEMQAFLARIGKPAGADPLATFTSLSASLQHVFLDQVFFAELKAVGQSDQGKAAVPRGYRMIETMFPASLGYTSNDAGSLVKTGDLNLLHATIQTQRGGDISIFGPGGNIFVGPLATEPNANLKLSDLGILTLGGGAINTFTDQSVRVNSSRVLTTQGGDVLMWSSNGDLDAGRGSKTTLSFPPLQVLFDRNDYESIDLAGFVTGAGIGTVKATDLAQSSNVYLLAPRGVIDFGTAGGRASGDLVVVAPVVANAGNIQVQGTTTGIPTVTLPSTALSTAANNTGAAAAKSADTPTAGGNRDRASVIIVEVVGYGGGEGEAKPAPDAGSAPAQPGATQTAPTNDNPQTRDDQKKKAGGLQ